jgi:hypothetical protein
MRGSDSCWWMLGRVPIRNTPGMSVKIRGTWCPSMKSLPVRGSMLQNSSSSHGLINYCTFSTKCTRIWCVTNMFQCHMFTGLEMHRTERHEKVQGYKSVCKRIYWCKQHIFQSCYGSGSAHAQWRMLLYYVCYVFKPRFAPFFFECFSLDLHCCVSTSLQSSSTKPGTCVQLSCM